MIDLEVFKDVDGIEYVILRESDETYTSMPKSVYDEQQKALKDAAN